MIVTLGLLGLATKWALAAIGTGGSVYAACRHGCGVPEVDLYDEEHFSAECFERSEESRTVEGLTVDEVSREFATESPSADAFVQRLATSASKQDGRESTLTARSHFMRVCVAELRLEFPLRTNRASDRAAMSKWLAGKLRARGVRATHAANLIPRAVALALNKSKGEILGDLEAQAARVRTLGGRIVYNWRRSLGLAGRMLDASGC